jgi:dodecin
MDHTYKLLEVAGSSTDGIDQAINNAISRVGQTMHALRWFEVISIRGELGEHAVKHWQVHLKVGITLDEPGEP